VFTETGKQPIRPQPFIRALDVGCEGPAPAALLKAIARGQAENAPGFLRNWANDYDYLYVVGPIRANAMPERLTELARGERFVLYRIVKGAGALPEGLR
jgi:hypothetical protein